MHMTVKNGRRWSTANAYLRPAMDRPNLTVVTHALVHKVLLEGKTATGVRYEQGGQVHEAKAAKEVILSAGSIGSPHLLQLSGIGKREVLEQAGVEVKHELPGVGENLQDHLEFYFQFRCQKPVSLNGKLDWWNKLKIGGCAGFCARMAWGGPPTILNPVVLFAPKPALNGRTCNTISCRRPCATTVAKPLMATGSSSTSVTTSRRAGGVLCMCNLPTPPNRPPRASVSTTWNTRPTAKLPRLRAPDPGDHQPAGHGRVPRCRNPAGVDVQSDEQIDAFVRQAVESAYHPSCSCKMGTDALAVVDPETRVRGIQNLRVVDSSIFPTIPNGNLNAPTIMVAERAATLSGGAGSPPCNLRTRRSSWMTNGRRANVRDKRNGRWPSDRSPGPGTQGARVASPQDFPISATASRRFRATDRQVLGLCPIRKKQRKRSL